MALQYLTVERLNTKQLTRIFSKIITHPDLQFNGSLCWLWVGSREMEGYGVIRRLYKSYKIHRWLYAWLVAPLPKGKTQSGLDHLCRRHICCNPAHLEFVSTRINVLRGDGPCARNARKTHCIRGHILDGENLLYRQGKRQCRDCTQLRARVGGKRRYHQRRRLSDDFQ